MIITRVIRVIVIAEVIVIVIEVSNKNSNSNGRPSPQPLTFFVEKHWSVSGGVIKITRAHTYVQMYMSGDLRPPCTPAVLFL